MRCSLGQVGLAATAAAVVVCVRGGDADPAAADAVTVAARTQGSASAAASPAESLFESAKAVLECHVCKVRRAGESRRGRRGRSHRLVSSE